MALVNDRVSIILEEDRISSLPDDIIHHIFSFLDMKYAVQMSTLSRRWKRTWTSMRCLNLDSFLFHTKPQFSKFVKHAISHRDNRTEVSAVGLTFNGPTTQAVVEDIVNYAYLYNVRQLTMRFFASKVHELPQYLFISHTLKHLTLINESSKTTRLLTSAWDFPALETLNLSNMRLDGRGDKSLDLFSKCVNLKDLTLHRFYMNDLKIFDVCASQLLNLTITDFVTFPKVFNVLAPQLKNLTASLCTCPNLYSVSEPNFLPLSTKGFNSLEKVSLCLSKHGVEKDQGHGPQLLNLFKILCSAKFLILDMNIIESLSSCLNQFSYQPSPFNTLKCLKINAAPLNQDSHVEIVTVQVKNYLLENSPSATFIMDYPKKRSREDQVPIDTMANKMAKFEAEKRKHETMLQEKRMLEAKTQEQDEVITHQKSSLKFHLELTEQQMEKIKMQDQVLLQQNARIKTQIQDFAKVKAMFDALKSKHDKWRSRIIKCNMEELKVLVKRKNLDYEVIRSMGCDMKSVMDMVPESLKVAAKTQFSFLYEELKSLLITHIDPSQWAQIETEVEDIRDSEGTPSNNIHISHGPDLELSLVPRPSSSVSFRLPSQSSHG